MHLHDQFQNLHEHFDYNTSRVQCSLYNARIELFLVEKLYHILVSLLSNTN